MIRFEVDESGYYVEWNDLPYDALYLVYYAVGSQVKIANGQLMIVKGKGTHPFITCPKRQEPFSGRHLIVPSGMYSVRLCTSETGEGDRCRILQEKKIFLGRKICIQYGKYFSGGIRNGFTWLLLLSDCYIPQNQIWISYKRSDRSSGKQIDMGIKVSLPEMQIDQKGHFSTWCLIPESGYQYIVVEVSAEIRDCIKLIKN